MSIPNKSSFKFGELTTLTGIKPYVIRFWETEFPEINPVVAEDGQKTYSRADVEMLFKIKSLLFEHKLSLQEAKAAMNDPNWKIHAPQIAPVVSGASKASIESARAALMQGLSYAQSIKAKFGWS